MSAPVWTAGYKPTKEDLKGLCNQRFETFGGLVLDCYLSYEAEEPVTDDDSGRAASVELEWALVEGVDISEVLDGYWAELIENEALQDLADQVKDAAFERNRGEA
jgi:hypothetical protein